MSQSLFYFHQAISFWLIDSIQIFTARRLMTYLSKRECNSHNKDLPWKNSAPGISCMNVGRGERRWTMSRRQQWRFPARIRWKFLRDQQLIASILPRGAFAIVAPSIVSIPHTSAGDECCTTLLKTTSRAVGKTDSNMTDNVKIQKQVAITYLLLGAQTTRNDPRPAFWLYFLNWWQGLLVKRHTCGKFLE